MKTRRNWRSNSRQNPERGAWAPALVNRMADVVRSRRGRLAGGVAVALLALAGGVWLLLGGDEGENRPPDPRAREYRDVDACLLTGADGIAQGTVAASVWEGMQQASEETRARVSYVPVTGEQSAANVRPFLNGLVQRQCEIVLTVGAPQAQAVEAVAGQHPSLPFVVVGEAVATAKGNVTAIPPGEGLKAAVVREIRDAASDKRS
ncbi:BMP family ABC transporter substrate-binding protein [Streptomyces sp. NPDC006172]|uniref:BMP family ABC transporter substrate-binding protein n=1 Tax=Streptomyces sp. NPDC006172 TaxID=3154470 RepID=UPI0033FF080D